MRALKSFGLRFCVQFQVGLGLGGILWLAAWEPRFVPAAYWIVMILSTAFGAKVAWSIASRPSPNSWHNWRVVGRFLGECLADGFELFDALAYGLGVAFLLSIAGRVYGHSPLQMLYLWLDMFDTIIGTCLFLGVSAVFFIRTLCGSLADPKKLSQNA